MNANDFATERFVRRRCELADVGVYNSIAKAVGTLNVDCSAAKFKKLLQTIIIANTATSKTVAKRFRYAKTDNNTKKIERQNAKALARNQGSITVHR